MLIKVENNAVSDDQAARCCLSNLAEGIRPMYRGQLVVTGRHMKPHDVVLLYDEYNDMIGPFEVEEVVHHFSATTGWVTTITPNTLCMAQDAPARIQLSGINRFLSNAVEFFNDYWIAIEIGLIAFGIVTGGTGGIIGRFILGGLRGKLKQGSQAVMKRMAVSMAKNSKKDKNRRIVAKALIESVRASQGRASAAAAKQAIGTRPHSVLYRIGRYLQFGNRILGAGSYIVQPMFSSSSFLRMEIGGFQAPVDISLLMLKGRPYTAGVEYALADVYSWSEQYRGFFGQLWGAFNAVEENTALYDEILNEWQDGLQ
jgi:hypothetical protein